MQPQGNPLANVGTPVGGLAAVMQQVVLEQKAQTVTLHLILDQLKAQTAASVANVAVQRLAGGGNLFKSMTDTTKAVMGDIKDLLKRAAFTGGGQQQSWSRSVEILLMSFGVFLAPAVMLVAAGMITLADIINRKLLKNLDGMADGMAKGAKWGVDAADATEKLFKGMTQAEKDAARARMDRDRTTGQRVIENITATGMLDRFLKEKFGRPSDRLMRDSDAERANEEHRRRVQQEQAGRAPETPAQREARFKWQAEHPGERFPGAAAAAKPGGVVLPKQEPNVLGDFAKNFRAIMQDMRQSYVRAPVMTGIGDLWREMQLRVYQSPLEQKKLILQEQMFFIAGEVLKNLEKMVPKEN